MGAPGRDARPRAAQNIERTTTDWQDASTHLRAIDRSSEHLIALVLEDRNTLSKLASLRVNKPVDPFAIDPSVAAITKNGISDPNAAHSAGDAGAPKKHH